MSGNAQPRNRPIAIPTKISCVRESFGSRIVWGARGVMTRNIGETQEISHLQGLLSDPFFGDPDGPPGALPLPPSQARLSRARVQELRQARDSWPFCPAGMLEELQERFIVRPRARQRPSMFQYSRESPPVSLERCKGNQDIPVVPKARGRVVQRAHCIRGHGKGVTGCSPEIVFLLVASHAGGRRGWVPGDHAEQDAGAEEEGAKDPGGFPCAHGGSFQIWERMLRVTPAVFPP